jgi:hypothetical protein
MTTYVLLKNKSINILYNDDSKNEGYYIYPLKLLGKIASDYNAIEFVKHSDVVCTDTNISVIKIYLGNL